ncbi:MAG: helix-turn-helix transcriptional regulator [Zoogloeaceae bacterium]|nr:helix-turn-helix transcriptional regulator [Zoogloeaceae bacterium]
MTISTATLPEESLQTGVPSSPASRNGVVIVKEFNAARPLPLPSTVSLDALLDSFGQDSELQAAMSEARREMAATVYADEVESLSALRLRAGLSQAQLAARMNTSQSYVARVESGTTDPGTDTVSRMAEALGVDEGVAFKAVRYQRETRGGERG